MSTLSGESQDSLATLGEGDDHDYDSPPEPRSATRRYPSRNSASEDMDESRRLVDRRASESPELRPGEVRLLPTLPKSDTFFDGGRR